MICVLLVKKSVKKVKYDINVLEKSSFARQISNYSSLAFDK